jgi:hypothetical protein
VSFPLDYLELIGCEFMIIMKSILNLALITAQANSDGLHILRDTRNYGLQLAARSSLS